MDEPTALMCLWLQGVFTNWDYQPKSAQGTGKLTDSNSDPTTKPRAALAKSFFWCLDPSAPEGLAAYCVLRIPSHRGLGLARQYVTIFTPISQQPCELQARTR